ncbi:hypothetical protein ABT001_26700 [Streptomyces sp. NPDC002793]|uniref:hypothetical protein n=1 Tax=Streptomyces sp. NPDC002793 TaxID=3154432 RepID=UPI00331E194B
MITLSTVDDLLAQSLLMDAPRVPSDVVLYDDTAYHAFADDTVPSWDGYRSDGLADDGAAQSLAALCEAVVAHCTAEQLTDFLTDQLPQPRAAWILGCFLQLAGADDGARFWWQYAAGGDDAPASYCLYLQHLAHGDSHAAALWQRQADAGTHHDGTDAVRAGDSPANRMVTADASVPTVLRILVRLTKATSRRHTETATAVIDFVATAVAIGYDRHPDLEIPLPGTDFAEHLRVFVAAASPSLTAASSPRTAAGLRTPQLPSATTQETSRCLPNRPTTENLAEHSPTKQGPRGPQRLLVEVTGTDHESTSAAFFKDAVAVCWGAVTAALPDGGPDARGTRLAYYLDRLRPWAACTQTVQAL